MADVLVSASLAAAFIAGIAALFAPCCITVLLPAYLGSIFRQKHTVFLMTFIFFIGLLVVFLPLGLGMAALGQLFSKYHDIIFIIGGIFLFSLGASILLGRHFSLPFLPHPKIKIQNVGSVFVLGIFSGFATLCCAPVLAGVLALAALPGSIFWGGMYAVAYVLGITTPLFVIAYFLDKTDFTKKFSIFKKQVSYPLGGNQISLTVADIISGATFAFMGILILYLAFTGQLAMSSKYQITINIYLANFTNFASQYFGRIPLVVWAIIIIVVFLLIARIAFKKSEEKRKS